jgi:hypothetical protein
MEEKEPKPKDSIQYILERLSEILPQDVSVDGDDTSFTSATTEIDASPEEGGRLIRAFIPYQASRIARRYYQAHDASGNVKLCN